MFFSVSFVYFAFSLFIDNNSVLLVINNELNCSPKNKNLGLTCEPDISYRRSRVDTLTLLIPFTT